MIFITHVFREVHFVNYFYFWMAVIPPIALQDEQVLVSYLWVMYRFLKHLHFSKDEMTKHYLGKVFKL